MTPIQLPPLAEIKAKILAALDANELQAQQPGFKTTMGCSYSGPCAIGVVLTPTERTQLDNAPWGMITNLIGDDYVKVHDDTPVHLLREMQRMHDLGNLDELRRLIQ